MAQSNVRPFPRRGKDSQSPPESLAEITIKLDTGERLTDEDCKSFIDDEDAVLEYYLFDEPYVERIMQAFMIEGDLRFGVNGTIWKKFRSHRKNSAKQLRTDTMSEHIDPVYVEAAKKANVNLEDMYLPQGYRLTDDMMLINSQGIPISDSPIVIAALAVDITSKAQTYRLAWFDHMRGSWASHAVQIADASQATTIVKALANYGAPVNSTNASQIVRWLAAFRTYNAKYLPVEKVATQLGWTPDGNVFIMPTQVIGIVDDTLTLSPKAGLSSMLRHMRRAGSFEEWKEAIKLIVGYPAMYAGLYTSLASVMLKTVFPSAEPFILDYASESGSGKTTAMRVAASPWGMPDDEQGIINSWKHTEFALTTYMGFLQNLPALLDESQFARNNRHKLVNVIHTIVQGQPTKGGNVDDDVRLRSSFRLLGISTGENSLLAFSTEGGLAARVLPVRARPMGRKNDENRLQADLVKQRLLDNYGHMGPRFLEFLIQNKEHWDSWNEQFKRDKNRYCARHAIRIQGNSALGRLYEHLALLGMTAKILHMELDVPAPLGFNIDRENNVVNNPAIDLLEHQLSSGDVQLSRSTQHFMRFRDIIVNNAHRFRGREEVPNKVPLSGWLGCWSPLVNYQYVAVSIESARQLMDVIMGIKVADEQFANWVEAGFISMNAQRGYMFMEPIIGPNDEQMGNIAVIRISKHMMESTIE